MKTKRATLAILAMLSSLAFAQEPADKLIEMPLGADCTYIGQGSNGAPDGYGMLSYSNGTQYRGRTFPTDSRFTGVKTDSSGSIFVGDYVREMPADSMTIIGPDGSIYVGQIKNNRAEGRGTYIASGCVYVGEFQAGQMNGFGTMRCADGRIYVGEVKDGQSNGQGCTWHPNGDVTSGTYISNTLNGKASYIYTHSDTFERYDGEFIDGMRSGEGVFRWKNGHIYTGSYANNMRNGFGTFDQGNGTVQTGQWKDDVFIGEEKSE